MDSTALRIVPYVNRLRDGVFAFTERCFEELGKPFEPSGRHGYYGDIEGCFEVFLCLLDGDGVVGTVCGQPRAWRQTLPYLYDGEFTGYLLKGTTHRKPGRCRCLALAQTAMRIGAANVFKAHEKNPRPFSHPTQPNAQSTHRVTSHVIRYAQGRAH